METITLLQNKRILLGVTGGIACYKVVDLASKLTQAGALVDCVLTESAVKFVAPLTFAAVTGRAALTDADLWRHDLHVPHVELGHGADVTVIAPATANTIAKIAHGIGDNLLAVSVLASTRPLIVAPAMDAGMWQHPATQANLKALRARGATIVVVGPGRMVEPAELLGWIRLVMGQSGPLAGRSVVVSAAGTQEAIDPVRFVGNRSSGKQGFALAQAAIDRGAHVTLIAGPTWLETPVGAARVDVESAEQMRDAVLKACRDADALIMAAAVADFRPERAADQKIKKTQDTLTLDLRLARTPDILLAVKQQREATRMPKAVIGFAAETRDLVENARAKLESKGLDLIVANDVSADGAGFAADTNRVTLLGSGGGSESLEMMSKARVAERVLDRLQARLAA